MTSAPSGATGAILTACKLTKSYSERPVLKAISFALGQREVLGILGPSGGGKTTLLRCLTLLDLPEDGSIEYPDSICVTAGSGGIEVRDSGGEGQPLELADVRRIRRSLGFVFQDLNLWDHLSVWKNLCLAPLQVFKESPSEVEERASALCERFGLSDFKTREAWRLSGGQRQRVAIARALMTRPRVLLLDEITSALDPILVVEIMDVLRKLVAGNISIILVTHHIGFASSVCDRVLFIDQGTIVQQGGVADLQNNPANERVRGFFDMLDRAR